MEKEKTGFKYLVRVMNTDLDGHRQIATALRKIKGINFSIANAVCVATGIEKRKKTGELSDDEVKKLDSALKDAEKLFPQWLLNRRKDYETGEDKQLYTSSIDFTHDMDIRTMKGMKCYRGMRHAFGLPSRGQRTKSNFRKNKGKGLGVSKSKQHAQKSERKD